MTLLDYAKKTYWLPTWNESFETNDCTKLNDKWFIVIR